MAFRILSDEEIALLDDEQRKRYEKEFAIYQQRVAFVEQLEAYENVRISPYEPKLKSITVIEGIEIKPYVSPKYTMSECEPVVKPKLQIKPFESGEPIVPDLPEISKPVDFNIKYTKKEESIEPQLLYVNKPVVPEAHFKKVEKEYTDLPVVPKISIVNKSYKGTAEVKPNLPAVIKPETPTDFSFEAASFNSSDIKAGIPDVFVPNIDLNPFVMPEKSSYSLPQVCVCLAEVKDFKKPEQRDTVLPKVAKPYVDVNYSKNGKTIQTSLPELFNISKVEIAFKKPEKSNAEIPVVVKPNANVGKFKKTELNKVELPRKSKLDIQRMSFLQPKVQSSALPEVKRSEWKLQGFEKTELQAPVLPSIAKLDSNIKPFEKPEHKNHDLPVVAKVDIVTKDFKRMEITKPDIVFDAVAVVPPSINAGSLEKIENKAVGLPHRVVIDVPDVYEELEQLLLAKKNEN
ncbi:hypothetical protein [Acetivibrio straminisolvens]|jgi:hypothetical protein|uniref:Collagen adhesin domain protein n=1 Tax=Acetivibrio straminisolvens JCM 21531 TaxID=1294263 RepID=W4VD23_9FIRM|nr:hypothetical protein [Acetivibrio straminisolvens]GAE90693.1 collagen adhesin domain protein [Acetivibrio straminisolvens JCM 21531]